MTAGAARSCEARATSPAAGTSRTPLRFADEYTDAETGFVYLRNRYYYPVTGSSSQETVPLTAVSGEPYGYVYGNPLSGIDPAGLLL